MLEAERGNLDAKTFEGLLAPILSPAYGTALHMTRNRDDAEDLVQEAAVCAFRFFHTFQEGTNFKAWFFRILTNLYLTKHRQKEREPEVVHLEDTPDLYLFSHTRQEGLHSWCADPAAQVLGKQQTEHVAAAIAALPEEFRTVCSLYFMEEFSCQEIAEMVDCPVGTVRSRLHRGRKALQRALWFLSDGREPGRSGSHGRLPGGGEAGRSQFLFREPAARLPRRRGSHRRDLWLYDSWFTVAAKQQDRLVLVCSRSSLLSPEIADAVLHSVQRERETGHPKLFPVLVDDFLLSDELRRMAEEKTATGQWRGDWVCGVREHLRAGAQNGMGPAAYAEQLHWLVDALRRTASC